jgi:hypothetical protein
MREFEDLRRPENSACSDSVGRALNQPLGGQIYIMHQPRALIDEFASVGVLDTA